MLKIMALTGSFWDDFVAFFSPTFGEYDNFKISETSFVAIKYIIIGIALGIVLASVSALYNRRVLGKFIRELIKKGATSPETALTLSELGFDKNPFVKYSLIHGYTLKRSTSCVEQEAYLNDQGVKNAEKNEAPASDEGGEATDGSAVPEKKKQRRERIVYTYVKEFKPDPKTAHFYIPEDKKYSMEIKFEAKGTNWISFILTLIVTFLLVGATVLFLPDLLRLVDNFINLLSGK